MARIPLNLHTNVYGGHDEPLITLVDNERSKDI